MNRYSYIKGYRKPKPFDALSILKPESFWLCLHGSFRGHVKRIVKLDRKDSNQYIYKVQTCFEPKWHKKNKWNEASWSVDEIYLKYDFKKQYKRINFFQMKTSKFWYAFVCCWALFFLMFNIVIQNNKWTILTGALTVASQFYMYRRSKW